MTPKIRKHRKIIIELLLSRAPESTVLNQLAEQYGAERGRFESVDKGESNCILCGLCIRVCRDIMKTAGIGAAYRGVKKKIVSPFEITRDICTGCAACAYVCPTGAIKAIETAESISIKNWNAEVEMKRCSVCGKAYAPAAFLKQLSEEVNVRTDVLESCPECRRKAYTRKISHLQGASRCPELSQKRQSGEPTSWSARRKKHSGK